MSTTTLVPVLRCRHCEVELRHGWPQPENDCCVACWLEPIADEGAAQAFAQLVAEGLMPAKWIGC